MLLLLLLLLLLLFTVVMRCGSEENYDGTVESRLTKERFWSILGVTKILFKKDFGHSQNHRLIDN